MGALSVTTSGGLLYARDAETGTVYNLVCTDRGRLLADVYLQDQTSVSVTALLHQLLGTVTLAANATLNSRTITLVTGHGASAGNRLVFKENGRYNNSTITNVAGDTITLDSPLDYAFTTAATVTRTNGNLAVNGSVTPVTFYAQPPAGVKWDITEMILYMVDDAAMDESKFGSLAALTNGIVLRKVLSTATYNIGNAKSNAALTGFCYDTKYVEKSGGGLYSFAAELKFGGQDNLGVVFRLDGDAGDQVQIIVQDDLSAITTIGAAILGHVVED